MNEQFLKDISWALILVSLTGSILNIRKDRKCFYFWIVSSLCLFVFNLLLGIYSQAVLFLIYTGLNIWGIREWRKRG